MDFDLMKQAIQRRDRVISIHAADEAAADNLNPDDVWESIVAKGEVIEDYPDAQRGPCCLFQLEKVYNQVDRWDYQTISQLRERTREPEKVDIGEAIKGFQCPICGHVNSYRLRKIDKIERVGDNTIILPITIGQCDFCGEQIMDAATTTRVFEARKKLAEGTLASLTPVGATYRAE